MKTLIIDNSNSRTKFAIADRAVLTEWRHVMETRNISQKTLQVALEGVVYEQVVLCSVVPDKRDVMKQYFTQPLHIITSESLLDIRISYPYPAQIGADRLANSEAAYKKYGAPCVVIDSGTAVTFDVVDADGAYSGGVIAPGLGLMCDYFVEKTALLPKLQPSEPESYIGKSTLEAMNIGAIAGFRGLIREILTGISHEMSQSVRVIATGGDAELLFRGINRIEVVDQDLTLEGILRIGLLNFDNILDKS